MKIGLIGLGKMGFGIAKRLKEKRIEVIATDIIKEILDKVKENGIDAVYSFEELTEKLDKPKVIWLMVPAGNIVDSCIEQVLPKLKKGDIIIDGGNSFYKDSIKRAEKLKEKGIYFLDVGTSGGIKITEGKACMMIGGEREAYNTLEHIFKALCVPNGYRYIGESGAGHLVKGYHNFVEYITMQGIAEGAEAMKTVSEREGINIDLKEVFDVWNHGSINQGRLVECAKEALEKYTELEIDGRIFGETTKEMERLVELAENSGVKVPTGKVAINERIKSQTKPSFASRLLNAMRNVFGGHIPGKSVSK